MIPLVVLIVSFAVFRFLGFVLPWMDDWQHALRAALGVMFCLTASAHWGRRRPDLVRMVPAGFSNPGLWVSATGIAEILIAMSFQIPRLALLTGVLAVIMLLCLFPANAKAAREKLMIGGRPVPALGPRLAIQIVFLAAVAAAVWPPTLSH
jgi:uncharacterized membrane protein